MKKLILKVWMILAISFLAIDVAGQAPTVVSLSPANGADGVAINSDLTIVFNENVQFNPSGTRYYIEIYKVGQLGPVVDFQVRYGSGDDMVISGSELIITPPVPLEYSADYYVLIEADAIQSLGGINFGGIVSDSEWTFTTESLTTTLSISQLIPNDGSTGVSVDSELTVLFNGNVQFNPSSTRYYVEIFKIGQLAPVADFQIHYGTGDNMVISGSELIISPLVPLEYSSDYYILIEPNAIQSIGGDGFSGIISDSEWSFITESEPVVIDPPAIVPNTMLPAPGATEVSRAPTIEVKFDKQIQFGVGGSFYLKRVSDDVTVTTFSANQLGATISTDLLSIVLSSPSLAYGTEYYVEISNDFVRSVDGAIPFSGVAKTDNWSFTTESAPPVWADGYPSISNQTMTDFVFNAWADLPGTYYGVVTQSSTAPTAEQISQGLNQGGTGARIIFNEIVDDNTEVSSQTVSFNSETPLGSPYYLHTVYRNGINFSEIRTLTIDRIVPQILSVNPSDNFVTFPIDSPLSISFNEPVVGSDGSPLTTGYFSLVKDGDPVEPITVGFIVQTNSEITTVTLSPIDPLEENSAYTLTINPVYDLSGNVSNATVINFETDIENQWIGGGGDLSDWTDAGNWSSGIYVPNKSVVIPLLVTGNYPILNSESDYTVFNLTVEPGALLTHMVGSLKVNGVFNLQSSSEYNASYIGGGLLDVSVGIVRIDQVIPNPSGSYLISSPVSGATQSSIGTTGPVMFYDNTTDTWNAINSEQEMKDGYGYVTWSNTDIQFSGNINTGIVKVPVIRTNGKGYGWNYAGNPYTASIDWDLLPIDNQVLEDAFWIWDTSNVRYGVYNYESGIHVNIDSSIIPSNHGFLVKVKSGVASDTLIINPSAIVANSSTYIKSSRVKQEYEHLIIAGVNGTLKDETAIAFIETAVDGVDKFDSEKLFSAKGELLQLFTLVGTMRSAINGMPFSNNKEISLGYSVGSPGEYSIELVGNQLEGKQVFLIDKQLDQIEDMTYGGTYTFSISQKGQNVNRFSLRFVNQVSTGEIEKNNIDPIHYYVQDRHVFALIEEDWIGNSLRILDMGGRVIKSAKLLENGYVNLGSYKEGVYILEVIDDNKQYVRVEKIAVY